MDRDPDQLGQRGVREIKAAVTDLDAVDAEVGGRCATVYAGVAFQAGVIDHDGGLPRPCIETVDHPGEGIRYQKRPAGDTQGSQAVQEMRVGEIRDFGHAGRGGSLREIELENGPSAGGVEGGVRGVAGGEVEDVGLQLGDAEEAKVRGETVDEERGALLGRVDLVDVGAGEEGDENVARGLDGEVLEPGAGWELVDYLDGEGKGEVLGHVCR